MAEAIVVDPACTISGFRRTDGVCATIGEVEEYFIDQLSPGMTFVFAGEILRFEGLEELFLAKPWERFTDFDVALNAPAFIRLCQTCDCWPVPYNAMFHTLAAARKVFVSKDQESKYPQLEDLIEQTKEAILRVGLDIADSPGCGFEGILEPWKKHSDQVVSYVAIKAESLWLVED